MLRWINARGGRECSYPGLIGIWKAEIMRHDSTSNIPTAGDQALRADEAGFGAMLGAHDAYLRDMLASLGYAMNDLARARPEGMDHGQAVVAACKACGSREACSSISDAARSPRCRTRFPAFA